MNHGEHKDTKFKSELNHLDSESESSSSIVYSKISKSNRYSDFQSLPYFEPQHRGRDILTATGYRRRHDHQGELARSRNLTLKVPPELKNLNDIIIPNPQLPDSEPTSRNVSSTSISISVSGKRPKWKDKEKEKEQGLTRQEILGVTDDFDRKNGRETRRLFQDLKWFWYENGYRERMKMMGMFCLIMLFTAHFSMSLFQLFSGISLELEDSDEDDGKNICQEENCHQAASFILTKLDENINPCDDFMKFACGKTSIDTISEENYKLQTIFNFGEPPTIPFDTRSNPRFGKVLRNLKETEIGKKVIKYYSACLDRRKRDETGVKDFAILIQRISLDKMEKIQGLSIEEILSRFFLFAPHLHHDTNTRLAGLFVIRYNVSGEYFVYERSWNSPISHSLSQKSFPVTLDIVQRALRYVKKELDLDEAEIQAMAADVICIEGEDKGEFGNYTGAVPLRLSEYLLEEKIQHCHENSDGYRQKMNKVGPDSTLQTEFQYAQLIQLIVPVLKKETNLNIKSSYRFSSRTWETETYFKYINENFFKKSTKRRIVRYLQWILYRTLYNHLTWDIFLTFTNITLQKGQTWEVSCVDSLFYLFSEVILERFLQWQVQDGSLLQDEDSMADKIAESMATIFEKAPLPPTILNCSKLTKLRAQKIRKILSDAPWLNIFTLSTNAKQKWLRSQLRQSFPYTAAAIAGDMAERHLLNYMKVTTWRGNIIWESFFYQNTSNTFRRRVRAIKLVTFVYSTLWRAAYVPYGLVEKPYFGNGIFALDLAGYGWQTVHLRMYHAFFVNLGFCMIRADGNFWKYLPEGIIPKQFYSLMAAMNYKKWNLEKTDIVKNEITKFTRSTKERDYEFELLNKNFLSYQSTQLSVEVLFQILKDYNRKNPQRPKNLHGKLAKFTNEQLFFLYFARVNCRNNSIKELFQTPVIFNVILANTKQFAKTWNCPKGSKMHRSGAFNFYPP